jgi:hypothetical protein
MINPDIVKAVDDWLDSQVGGAYKDQPMAQDWARITKGTEELGEAIAEFIILTGQNPRKEQDTSGDQVRKFMMEMADAAMTIVYGMQHFTKDAKLTEFYLRKAQDKHMDRALGLP